MPTSYSESIPTIVKVLEDKKPKKVLDIGTGNGKYGLLTKEYCGQDVIIDGIEAWKPYLTDTHKSIYRNIFIDDVTKMSLKSLEKYDIYLMIDVIEHLPKTTAHRILRELNGLILISTPIEDYRAHYENHFEDHVSHWKIADFTERYKTETHSTNLSTIVLIDTSIKKSDSQNEINRLNNELRRIYNSKSWRLTKPLRAINHIFNR